MGLHLLYLYIRVAQIGFHEDHCYFKASGEKGPESRVCYCQCYCKLLW